MRFGEYYVIAVLHRGGEAVVYKGIHSHTKEVVAIRALPIRGNEDTVKRHFLQEMRILQQLKHRCIIPLKTFGVTQEDAYLVMPFVPDGSLADLIAKGQQFSIEQVLDYLQQAGEALSYAHAHDIAHLDVKPSNLLRGSEGILLSDFGIARHKEDTITIAKGTFPYYPPEQAEKQPELASDQYALAVTACWLLTRQFPHDEKGLENLRTKHPALAPVLERALNTYPANRYPSMVFFLRALNLVALSGQQPLSPAQFPPPPPAEPRPPQPPRRKRSRLSGLAAALLGVLLLLATFSTWFLVSRAQSTSLTALCLATDLPLNGTEAKAGREIQHGVELALMQSPLFTTSYQGYHLRESDMDDSSQQDGGQPAPTVGAGNVQGFAQQTSSSCLPIAVIGPANSPVAVQEIPIAIENHLLLLSPSNTAPCLTLKNYPNPPTGCTYDLIHPQGFSNTYARLPGTDIDQGYRDADFLSNPQNPTDPGKAGLGARRIVIIEDEEVYGIQLA